MEYRTYNFILQGSDANIEIARAFAQCGAALYEGGITTDTIEHARYEETINGIDIYYDYAADYYFFCPED